MYYTLTMNPSIDYYISIDTLSPGHLNRAQSGLFECGGKGLNISRILSALGEKSIALGLIGSWTGSYLQHQFSSSMIKPDFIHLDSGETRINVKIEAEEETEINFPGPTVSAESLEKLDRKLDLLDARDTLFLSGSLPPGVPSSFYADTIKRLTKRGVRVCLDTFGKPLLDALPFHPFLIKPNLSELSDLFSKDILPDDVEPSALALQKKGAENVLVSLGNRGAFLLDKNQKTHSLPALKGQVMGTIGAGDSMMAGFIVGYDRSFSFSKALKMGSACGCATAFSPFLADADAIQHTLKKYQLVSEDRS